MALIKNLNCKKSLIIIILILLTYCSFSKILRNNFIDLDDDIYVTKNPYVQHGLSVQGIKWAFNIRNKAGLWIPLTWISLMLDSQLYGLNAGGYHLTNLILHILNVILLFVLFFNITGGLWESAFLAALFAVHPLKVESVAWITERKDVLCTLFFLLTILAYNKYLRDKDIKSYSLLIILYILGLMAKPMIVTLPFVLLLLDYWPFERNFIKDTSQKAISDQGILCDMGLKKLRHYKGIILEKMPLLFISVVIGLITIFSQETKGALMPLGSNPIGLRAANAIICYVKYIGKMLLPLNLAVFYPYPPSYNLWQVIGSFSIILLVSALILMYPKPYLFVGWLWYLITLLPVIGLFQAGLQQMADRFTYIPLIGLFIIISWGANDMFVKFRYKNLIKPVLAISIIIILVFITRLQTGYWQDSITLFKHTIKATQNNWLIQNNLGYNLVSRGKVKEGIRHYDQALEIKPDFANAYYNIGNAYMRIGNIKDGIKNFKRAIAVNPNYGEAHNNLGYALSKTGQRDEAKSHYLKTLQINPDSVPAHFNLGTIYAEEGDLKSAIIHYRKAISFDPVHKQAHLQLYLSYLKTDDFNNAQKEYNTIKALYPDLAKLIEKMTVDK